MSLRRLLRIGDERGSEQAASECSNERSAGPLLNHLIDEWKSNHITPPKGLHFLRRIRLVPARRPGRWSPPAGRALSR
jgi:hypothetical protein